MAEQRGPDDPSNLPAVNPSDLSELLAAAAAVRGGAVDADAERRVLAAFRAARDEGAHRASAHNRRRDDWRPERRGGRPVRTTLVALVASLTLGGVAVAAIGSAGGGTRDEGAERGGPLPASSAPTGPAVAAPNQSGPAQADRGFRRPPSAQDTEAHCRAYDSGKKSGKALDSTAWQRLIQAAGGAENVGAYCAEQLAEKKEKEKQKKKEKGNAGKDKPSKSPKAPKASKAPGSGATKKPKSTKSPKGKAD
ncbi:hypothetical protein [Streptomyces umbrinus]|uniref:hypothetical protein n=1 Tax=Streptomyces umbrinus TaxID=67370 RepID=UPI0033E104CA